MTSAATAPSQRSRRGCCHRTDPDGRRAGRAAGHGLVRAVRSDRRFRKRLPDHRNVVDRGGRAALPVRRQRAMRSRDLDDLNRTRGAVHDCGSRARAPPVRRLMSRTSPTAVRRPPLLTPTRVLTPRLARDARDQRWPPRRSAQLPDRAPARPSTHPSPRGDCPRRRGLRR